MTITSRLTSIENYEASPTYTIAGYGGGPGASDNTDIFIEGGISGGRRADNKVDHGFGVTVGAIDLSGAGEHIKMWLWVTQWNQVIQVQLRMYDGVNADDHELPTVEFPQPIGGFIPLWVDVSRAPEVGGSLDESAVTEFGLLLDIGDVGGTTPNLIQDEWMYGTSGLLWDGASGDFDAFRTYEATNAEGVLVTINGIDYCYARLEIGSATVTGFVDSGFTLVFPDQSLVAPTFMGVTIDLQNASTDIDLSNATIQSADPAGATIRPDFIVSGTSGALDLDTVNLLGIRTIDLTSACTISGGVLDTINLTQGSADISDCTIQTRAAASIACITDPTFGITTDLHDILFVQAGAGHALELDTATTYTFTNLSFSGYGADFSDAAALDVTASSGTVIVNWSGGTEPTYKTAGATVIIQNSVDLTITVKDEAGSPIENAQCAIYKTSDDSQLMNEDTLASGIATESVPYTAPTNVYYRVRKSSTGATKYLPGKGAGQYDANGFSVTVTLIVDPYV